MTNQDKGGGKAIVVALTLAGLVLMGAAFVSPMWWVSLKAPNYPEHTFPSGVRIHLHWTRVANGCATAISEELADEEPLDCVHEMDTINHYIGMHPIAAGAQREFAAAPYIFLAFGVLAVVGALGYSGPFWWLLMVPAAALPLGFLADFSAWLWWFGHNLHPWAAFTVKPFMPTVLGEGKVAQFSTYSYPHYGMALAIGASVCFVLAALKKAGVLRQQRDAVVAPTRELREAMA